MTDAEIRQFYEKFTAEKVEKMPADYVLETGIRVVRKKIMIGRPEEVLEFFQQILTAREKAAFEDGREFEYLVRLDSRKPKKLSEIEELKSKYYPNHEDDDR